MSLSGGGISNWLLYTYRKIRFLVIVLLVFGLVLWYFNSVLFYDVIDGTISGTVTAIDMLQEFIDGF